MTNNNQENKGMTISGIEEKIRAREDRLGFIEKILSRKSILKERTLDNFYCAALPFYKKDLESVNRSINVYSRNEALFSERFMYELLTGMVKDTSSSSPSIYSNIKSQMTILAKRIKDGLGISKENLEDLSREFRILGYAIEETREYDKRRRNEYERFENQFPQRSKTDGQTPGWGGYD